MTFSVRLKSNISDKKQLTTAAQTGLIVKLESETAEPEGKRWGVFQFRAAIWFIFMLDMEHFWKLLQTHISKYLVEPF